MKGLFDTNIIIDYLNGEEKSKIELENYAHRYISIITYIEVLVGISNSKEKAIAKDFLKSFHIVDVGLDISELAIISRKHYRLKVPDALILASAQHVGAVLVTRNTKDFIKDIPIVRIPYEI